MSWTVTRLYERQRTVSPNAAVAVGDKIYAFGGSLCDHNNESIPSNTPMDVRVLLQTIDYQWIVLKHPDPSSEQYNEHPSQLHGHTTVVHNDLVYIWGGHTNNGAFCNILFCFDTRTNLWSRPSVHGEIPVGCVFHTACVVKDSMFIFGRFEYQYQVQVHRLDFQSMKWSVVATTGEPPILSDSYSTTAINNSIYMFGGRGFSTNFEIPISDKVIIFDVKTSCWIRPEVNGDLPEGRWGHSAFCYKDQLFIFGGNRFTGFDLKTFNDLRRYSPESCCWSVMEPMGNMPCPKRLHSSCVIVDNRVYLFCRMGFLGCLNDLHVLDFAPSLRTLAMMKVIEHGLNKKELPETVCSDINAITSSLPNSSVYKY